MLSLYNIALTVRTHVKGGRRDAVHFSRSHTSVAKKVAKEISKKL